MKKAFTLLVLLVTPTMACAQGTVVFANNDSEPVKQWTSLMDNTLIPAPVGGGQVMLFTATNGTPLNPLFTVCPGDGYTYASNNTLASFLAANPGWWIVAQVGFTLPAAGSFDGGTVVLQSSIAGGATAEYFIIGWTGPYTTFDAAWAAGTMGANVMFGSSPMLTTRTGDLTRTPPVPAVPLSDSFTGMTLSPLTLDPMFGLTAGPTNQEVVVGGTATFSVGIAACPAPSYYQWYFNGVSVPGANTSSFQISNAQLTNAGTYCVVLSNAAWAFAWGGHVQVSASATLTVLVEPPIITHPPQTQTAFVGSTVDCRASAAGSPPLAYQWFFNTTTALSGGTDLVLRLTNVQPAQAGVYTLVVTNITGAVTSPPAMLSVIPPVEQRMVPGLSLLGEPGSLLNLENANTLGPAPAWVTLDSVIFTNTPEWYFDVSEPLPPQRFYRSWQSGTPSVRPSLDLHLVPAITLTGTIGGSVRVDYINQFGPTDAWVTLATVPLTNTSQLYFDTSSIGQPARLYRLVQVP